jgi:hypothetical protein
MASYLINITVGGGGNFTYSPSTLRAQITDKIYWKCPKDFALMFLDGTPIEMMETHGKAGIATPKYQVSPDAKGHYHYAVAVWNGTRVFIDSGCPDIVIN